MSEILPVTSATGNMPYKLCAIHGKAKQSKYKPAHPQRGSKNMCPDCYFASYPTGDDGNGCKHPLPMKHFKPRHDVAFCDGIESLSERDGRVMVSDLPDDQP